MSSIFRYRKISKWTNPIIIGSAILLLAGGFFLWMSRIFSHNTFFYLTLIPTVAFTYYTLYFVFNTINGYLTKKKEIRTIPVNALSSLILGFLSYSYIASAQHLRPAKELDCAFDLKEFEKELKEKFQADTIVIISAVIQEEPYFPQIRCPIIYIDNGKTNKLNFKELDCNNLISFDNYAEIKEGLRKEGQFIADSLYEHCNMSDYDKVLIQFCKLDTIKNRDCLEFLLSYSNVPNE